MPASPSRPPGTKARLWPWIVLGVVLIGVVILLVLPASLLGRLLPPGIDAQDYSGTIWHGSVGTLKYAGTDAGALEWRLQPAALLRATLAANVHWVKTGFVLDGDVQVDRNSFTAQNLHGGGPLEDLHAFGLAPSWTGIATVSVTRLRGNLAAGGATLVAIVGDVQVDDLTSTRFTDGVSIGGYKLHAADGAVTPDADASAELTDTGGPLEVQCVIHYTSNERRALLSGTVRERGALPPALQKQVQSLAQLRPRDAQGRLPVDLEFTL